MVDPSSFASCVWPLVLPPLSFFPSFYLFVLGVTVASNMALFQDGIVFERPPGYALDGDFGEHCTAAAEHAAAEAIAAAAHPMTGHGDPPAELDAILAAAGAAQILMIG